MFCFNSHVYHYYIHGPHGNVDPNDSANQLVFDGDVSTLDLWSDVNAEINFWCCL